LERSRAAGAAGEDRRPAAVLDFIFSRVNDDGSQHQFQVSGEPMFNQSCRFIGYRGIGVELTASNKEEQT
jgi:hypothetical protein